jgi:hypothetical protein
MKGEKGVVEPIKDAPLKLDSEMFQGKLKSSYAELARLIKSDMALLQERKSLFSGFKKEDVIKWMRNPPQYQKQLTNLSKFLYGVSTHYRRLVGYFADMGVDSAWGVSLYGTDYIKKSQDAVRKYYNDTLEMIDVMNIPHEYNKIKTSLWTEGVYYGYEYSGDNSYFIQKLHSDFCRINGIVDGSYVFEFDFNYFFTHPAELKTAAPEFRIKFNNYKKDKGKSKTDVFDPTPQWQQISPENSICIKLDESISYIFPPFMGLFLDIYDIQDYKELKKVKEELENYMLLVAKIPLYEGDKEPEQFLLDMDNAIKYGQQIIASIPDEVGLALSPFESIEAIPVSETSQREKNAVSDAESAMWSAAGVNQNIFSGEATTEGVMSFSVMADESSVFAVNRQFERWVNRKIKYQDLIKENFAFYFLDVTVYNQKRKVQEYTNQVKNGQPFKLEMAAAQGLPPSRYEAKLFLENTLLKIRDRMEPPLNSNVLSGKDGSDTEGRPTNDKVVENE